MILQYARGAQVFFKHFDLLVHAIDKQLNIHGLGQVGKEAVEVDQSKRGILLPEHNQLAHTRMSDLEVCGNALTIGSKRLRPRRGKINTAVHRERMCE